MCEVRILFRLSITALRVRMLSLTAPSAVARLLRRELRRAACTGGGSMEDWEREVDVAYD